MIRKTGGSLLKHSVSLTRLAVGLVESSVYDLLDHLQTWESNQSDLIKNDQQELENEIIQTDEHAVDVMRYALIGAIFKSFNKVESGAKTFDRASRLIGRFTFFALSPLANSDLVEPVKRRFNNLVDRGEEEVQNLINYGKEEDIRCRMLAEQAVDDTVDGWIEYLTHNPEVRQLVEMQSASLATEVVEEVRERTVSADTLLESIARAMLRRVPRSALPEPPPEARARAYPLHPKSLHPRKPPVDL
jgi:hypothetical protein